MALRVDLTFDCAWAVAPAEDAGRWPTSPWELRLSEGAVRDHLSSAIGKTGARTRAEAVRLADDHGWLPT